MYILQKCKFVKWFFNERKRYNLLETKVQICFSFVSCSMTSKIAKWNVKKFIWLKKGSYKTELPSNNNIIWSITSSVLNDMK